MQVAKTYDEHERTIIENADYFYLRKYNGDKPATNIPTLEKAVELLNNHARTLIYAVRGVHGVHVPEKYYAP